MLANLDAKFGRGPQHRGGSFELGDARRQIDEYVAAGVTHIIFSVIPGIGEWVRRFARRLSPPTESRN